MSMADVLHHLEWPLNATAEAQMLKSHPRVQVLRKCSFFMRYQEEF